MNEWLKSVCHMCLYKMYIIYIYRCQNYLPCTLYRARRCPNITVLLICLGCLTTWIPDDLGHSSWFLTRIQIILKTIFYSTYKTIHKKHTVWFSIKVNGKYNFSIIVWADVLLHSLNTNTDGCLQNSRIADVNSGKAFFILKIQVVRIRFGTSLYIKLLN